jgi:hypothetical protein
MGDNGVKGHDGIREGICSFESKKLTLDVGGVTG